MRTIGFIPAEIVTSAIARGWIKPGRIPRKPRPHHSHLSLRKLRNRRQYQRLYMRAWRAKFYSQGLTQRGTPRLRESFPGLRQRVGPREYHRQYMSAWRKRAPR